MAVNNKGIKMVHEGNKGTGNDAQQSNSKELVKICLNIMFSNLSSFFEIIILRTIDSSQEKFQKRVQQP